MVGRVPRRGGVGGTVGGTVGRVRGVVSGDEEDTGVRAEGRESEGGESMGETGEEGAGGSCDIGDGEGKESRSKYDREVVGLKDWL